MMLQGPLLFYILIIYYTKFGIPGVIGCIDGSHFKIHGPPVEEEHLYYCRKHYHSINVQMVCDSDCRIINVNSKFGGANHDSFIWDNSQVNSYMQSLHAQGEICWLLGDSGYPLRPWLMTPYLEATAESPECTYNQKHMVARVLIENTFGRLKNRWRCLCKDRVLHYKPQKCAQIIQACCVLYNIALDYGVPEPDDFGQNECEQPATNNIRYNDGNQRATTDLIRGRALRDQIARRLHQFLACSRDPLIYAQTTSTEVGRPVPRTTEAIRTNATMYAWSSWGSWSPCSKTCGGGVAVQERHCLPRDPARMRRSRKRRKLVRSVEHTRRTRNVIRAPSSSGPDCPGLARRYHECNTAPCPGPLRDARAEQCAVYDRRPFRGRFYTWVPYVDGDSPCTLNCRPRGQQFYASLALVVDGTPCTKPGFRAICVQGDCKAVGREGVLSSAASRELRCGRRLVSGLFSRPRLPLGYSYVTTVPRGACRLNVSEVTPSDNYIALKVSNGSYIMNGEFAVSAAGTYEAAGARFVYSRQGSLDNVVAHGPIHHPIDIMILYTQPNPNIKYEYLTDLEPDETISNDIPTANPVPHHTAQRHHRHHSSEAHLRDLETRSEPSLSKIPDFNNLESQSQVDSNVIGSRKFIWKILEFSQCSRSCGGGLQIGKFKCAEVTEKGDKEVSPFHCNGSPPPARRRRCGGSPCPPRWRAAAWGPCPVCGPAHRTRIVGCVQDHARGITKISDQKCPLPMPPSSELCDIPNCDGTAATTSVPRLDARRQVRPKDRTDTFREGPVISLATNLTDNDIGTTPAPSFSHSAGGGWLYTEWSQCVGWCVGGGVQSRGVRCVDPNGCTSHRAPEQTQTCAVRKQCDAQWFTSEWSPCSAPCGGKQVRGVICISGNGRRLRDGSCRANKPDAERACGGACSPSWYLSDWSECQGPCEAGVQSRTVWCARGGAEGAGGAARDADCAGVRPPARRSCVPSRCSTRPSVKTTIVNAPPSVSDPQQRVTRHQSHTAQNVRDRSYADGACVDKLNNCALAVQARLCHYPYYADYCCKSCHGR